MIPDVVYQCIVDAKQLERVGGSLGALMFSYMCVYKHVPVNLSVLLQTKDFVDIKEGVCVDAIAIPYRRHGDALIKFIVYMKVIIYFL